MKSTKEISDIIAEKMKETAEEIGYDDINLVICSERIFVNDYKPTLDDFAKRNNASQDGDYNVNEYDSPDDMPFSNTVFMVLKFGQGQINNALLNLPISIQCLSLDVDYTPAFTLFRKFCERYNFEYTDGIVMSFFTPEISSSAESVYSGYRAFIGCKGNIKVAEDGVIFVTEVWSHCDEEGLEGWFRIPFINMNDSWNAQSDPQCFSGYSGRTMNLNKQSTTTVTFNCYLWCFHTDEERTDELAIYERRLNWFSKNVLNSKYCMNRKFRLYFKTNVTVTEKDKGIYNSDFHEKMKNVSGFCTESGYPLAEADGWFTLVGRTYAQAWGDVSAYSLSFTESLESEN